MSHILFTPYADDHSTFSANEMNKPLETFDEALIYMKNIIITCDGDIISNRASGNFSFTGALRILFTSPINGTLIQNTVNSAVVKMELGDCLYVDLNEVNETILPLKKVQLTGGNAAAMTANRILIAYRNSVTGELSLANTLHKIVNGSAQAEERIVRLQQGAAPEAGQILCLVSDGTYGLADNGQLDTTLDLVMVKTAGVGEASVIETGLFTVLAEFDVGKPIYLGMDGNFTQTVPTESGRIVKCVGWAVETNVIKFKPDSFGIKLI